ncbi:MULTISPECIES: GNAT family N-acetyltransferase [Vibrio]|uniref:GNAT family N-acetyltransferase n=1 Tax=Vibrio TaxID=662 RepID=UPI002074B449|nr:MULTISPECIES: GNAT family N-acetyltransferase [Vibrio]USD34918.1 GNAT family N-acetyltransferase [Vibrio sp. SCSIO 43186]USD47983.1 GNAT family N-acetyltransferase [Vibrio sp. SCSIO 43145]USD72042.1 GNAT family N-acetyltransferase [Vibrio sp. SCSIO 43139]USD97712.1 GNAT family N-acetyltransferase [Vibrio coralliilyticus]
MDIKTDQLDHPEVIKLLKEHLADMNATSPPESVHALDTSALKATNVTFWTCWKDEQLLGCAAIKALSATHAELKSMRTTPAARNQGIASSLLSFAIDQAKLRGYQRISLETGSMSFFKPARELYTKFGFEYCSPFADYQPDPNSRFMTLELSKV